MPDTPPLIDRINDYLANQEKLKGITMHPFHPAVLLRECVQEFERLNYTPKPGKFEVGDIVQVDPDKPEWGACLVTVTEVKSWGVQGYTTIPGFDSYTTIPGFDKGDAYIRLEWKDIEQTGGRAVWMPKGDEE